MSANLENDPIAPLLKRSRASAEILTDPQYGYDRVYPAPDVLAEMGTLYSDQITRGDEDFKLRFEKMREAEECYEADPANATESITIPLAKSIINQQVAWATNQILSKDPYITWRPLDGGSYVVPSGPVLDDDGEPIESNIPPIPGSTPAESSQLSGAGPQPIYNQELLSSADIAANLQDYQQYLLSASDDWEQIVENTIHSVMSGENPTYWRIDYDPSVLHAKTRNFYPTGSGDALQIYGVEDTEIVPRSLVRIRHVSGYSVTYSQPATDLQTAWWVSERTPRTNQQIWERIQNGIYDFAVKLKPGEVADERLIRKVIGMADNRHREDDPVARSADRIDQYVSERPQEEHDVRTVQFFHPLLLTQPGSANDPESSPAATGKRKRSRKRVIEVRSLIGELHVPSRTFLNLTVNWSWSGQRLIVPFFRQRRSHRFSGMSASGDAMPIQNLVSALFDLQIKNKVQNTIKVGMVKENSPTARHLKTNGGRIKPGDWVPFDEPTDVRLEQLGSSIETTAPEIAMLTSIANDLLIRDETDIPNRTPGATVAQMQAVSKQQQIQLLRSIRRGIAKGAMFMMQTVAQFNRYATIPYNDPDKRRITDKVIGFPREVISNHFACFVTATGDEDTPDSRFEKFGILSTDTDKQNESDLRLLSMVLDLNQPQAKRDAAKFLLLRRNRVYGERMKTVRLDEQHFVIDERMLEGWEQSLKAEAAAQAQAAAEAAQAQAAQQQQPPPTPSGQQTGDQNGNVSAPGSSGPLPPAPPGPGAPVGMPGQPVLPGVPGPGPIMPVQSQGALVQ